MTTSDDGDAQQYMRISDIVKEHQKMLMPICGFEKMPLVSLEEAIEPLASILPKIQDYAYVAKQRCDPVPADGLTKDQSASIILYSMQWEPHDKCLYVVLNETLRAEDRQKLKPWFSYLKLLLTALARIPSKRHFVYRGVKMDLSNEYTPGKTFVWWGFSSCTSNIGVLENEQFLGKKAKRTMFSIDCESGKDISRHSYYKSEEEILLIAARQLVVNACFEPAPDLHMIQLTETESPIPLLKTMIVDLDTSKPLSEAKPDQSVDVEKDVQIKKTSDLSEMHSFANEKPANVNRDEHMLKLITNEIICILELDDNENKDEIINDLLKHGRQSLNKYEEHLIPDIYTTVTDGNDNELMKHLRSYFEQQWKIQYNCSNEWFVQFLNDYKCSESHKSYDQILTRTAQYGYKYMKNCAILSITLQLLFERINDQCLEKTNTFNGLWFTITTDGLKSIVKYSDYINVDVMNEQINKKQPILFQALREYYRQELLPLLQQSNIPDKQNLYDLTLDNVAEFGWRIGLQAVQKKIAPKNYKILSEKLHSCLQQQNATIQIKDNIGLTETTTQSIDILPNRDIIADEKVDPIGSVSAQVSAVSQAVVIKESQKTEHTFTGPVTNTLQKSANHEDTAYRASTGLFAKIGSWFSTQTIENEEFAKPGTYKELYCKGRRCAKCGKCRDWYYTGDESRWQWIRNFNSWEREDWGTWHNDRVYERFKKRDGATCDDFYFFRDHTDDHFLDYDFNACSCEDNTQNAF